MLPFEESKLRPRPRRPSLAIALALEPRLPHRARLPDPAPLPHQRPAVEQGPGHGDGVEPPPVAGRLAPFQADRSHRRAIRQLSIKR